jgi:amidase
MGGIPFDPRIRKMVDAQKNVFENLGCIVEQAEPDWTGAFEGYDILRAWGFATTQAENVRLHPELVKETIHWEVERGLKLSASDIARAHTLRSRAWDRMRTFQETYEYFVAPTTQVLPFDINQPYATEIDGVKMSTYVEWQKSCILISAMENPAISVPCGFTEEGLPVGLQIVGRHRDEWSLLQIAHAFEQASNHNGRDEFSRQSGK